MTLDADQFLASCHCGTVKFRVKLSNGLRSARRCTCSFCRMRGAVAVSANLSGIVFLDGQDSLSTYQFNTGTARHYFCSRCGIYTHHQRRSNSHEFGVNVACLEGLSPFDFQQIPVFDGVQHPSESPKQTGPIVAGVLRYEPWEDGKGLGSSEPILHEVAARIN